MFEESKKNMPEVDIMKIDTVEKNSIAFEPMSPDREEADSSKLIDQKKDDTPAKKADEEKPKGPEPVEGETTPAEEADEEEPEKKETGKDETPAEKETWPQKQSRYAKRITELTRDREMALRKAADLEAEVAALKGKPKEDGAVPKGERPKAENFETYDDYIVALGEWSAARTIEERTKKSAKKEEADTRSETEIRFQAQIETAKSEIEDFEKVVFDPKLPISQDMMSVLKESDRGAEVLYYLGQHPEEAGRIYPLSPIGAAKELGRIEERLEKKPAVPAPKKKVISEAPEPINPVEDSGHVDKEPHEMSNAEYRRWRLKKKSRSA